MKPLFSTPGRARQNVEKIKKFSNFHENSHKKFWIWKFIFEELPTKEISRVVYKRGDLLYEFPAETRLTVYRRLDITRRAGVFPMEIDS